MNNEPVAYIDPYDLERLPHYDCHIGSQQLKNGIPLYTQDQLEKARKLGMQQERALWNLSASTQEIMDTHPVKEFFEDEPQAEELHEIMQSNAELTNEDLDNLIKDAEQNGYMELYIVGLIDGFNRARAILRKAQE